MTLPFAETLTMITRTTTGQDSDGGDIPGTVETTVRGAFAPAGSIELVQGQSLVLDHDTVYLETGTPTPKATDQLRRNGVVYNIDARPRTYLNPFTGQAPGPILALLRVTG
jgi:hypothetical protein